MNCRHLKNSKITTTNIDFFFPAAAQTFSEKSEVATVEDDGSALISSFFYYHFQSILLREEDTKMWFSDAGELAREEDRGSWKLFSSMQQAQLTVQKFLMDQLVINLPQLKSG